MHYNWKKGEKIKLSANFSTSEFECKCKRDTCKNQMISIELIDKLQDLRNEVRESIKVHSGYRCPEHNIAIGGATKSQHMLGNAADVSIPDLDKLYDICDSKFEALGDGRKKGFLHVDVRKTSVKKRWTY